MIQPMNLYMRYSHTGDDLKWAFTKFSAYNAFMMSYYGWKTYLSFVYPSRAMNASKLSSYYEEMFEIVFDFDFKLDDETNAKSDRLSYLEKTTLLEDIPIMYLSDLAIHRYFPVDDQTVYFLKKSDSQESRYATAYFNLGIYDGVYDDRVMIVPKSIANSVIEDLNRIQTSFQYNNDFMEGVCQYVIQTHAIVNGLEIKTLDPDDFLEYSHSFAWFLSNKTSAMLQG